MKPSVGLIVVIGLASFASACAGPIASNRSITTTTPFTSAAPLPASSMKSQGPKIMSADRAAQDIRRTVTEVRPVILPAAIPATYQAQLYDDSQSFSVDYLGASGQKISFAIVVANPPPGTANVRQSSPTFRGVRALYQVDDATNPTSHRWLMWNEPGTSVGGQPGVPYLLATEGLTESEFWSLANSIGP